MSTELQVGRPRLDLGRYELTLDGRRLRLERQPMDLLVLFVQRRGQLVTRDDIVERLWGKDILIDVDRSINAAVRKIRSALQDDRSNPTYLETVIGKGYRFIGDVQFVGAGSVPTASPEPARLAIHPGWRLTSVLLGFALLVGLAAALAWVALRWRRAPLSPQAQIRSIAVLPLANLSGDSSQEYFADGTTEMLTTDLGRISQLRVISRTSAMHYKNTHETLPQIARELGVQALIEGGVLRSGNRLRLTVQLVQAHPEQHLWASSYEGDARDALALQDEAARSIAEQVQVTLSPQEKSALASARPIDPATEDEYYRGRFCLHTWTEDSLEAGIEHFKQAVQADPAYAQAWAGLAYSYGLMGVFGYLPRPVAQREGRISAEKALKLDASLSEAHVSLAVVRWPPDGAVASVQEAQQAWSATEAQLRLATGLNPNDALAHQTLGYLLVQEARSGEGIREMKRARELDPLSPNTQHSLGVAFYFAGRFDEALEQLRQIPDPDGNSERRHFFMAQAYQRKAMSQQALVQLLMTARFAGLRELESSLEKEYRSGGYPQAENLFLRAEIKEQRKKPDLAVNSMEVAADYALLGQKEQSLEWLAKGFREHARGLAFLKVDDRFEPLRPDPRFQNLLRRIGL